MFIFAQVISKFFELIAKIELVEYDELLLTFLFNYTQNVLSNISKRRQERRSQLGISSMTSMRRTSPTRRTSKKNGKEKEKEVEMEEDEDTIFNLYDFDIFWKLMQDSAKVPNKVKELALTSLPKLITSTDVKTEYLIKTISTFQQVLNPS
jgi:hypothetical protein